MNIVNKHKKTCKMLNRIYKKKNHDYGNSFGNAFRKYGIISAFVRMEDKWNRLSAIISQDNLVTDECIEDTILDMANYLIMTYMELQKGKKKNNKMKHESVDIFIKKKYGDNVKISHPFDHKSETIKEMSEHI